ncbi:MAG: glycosyltransferase [Verrucomicrobiae bacterium]|nr:glycosyltransferase [Verrucomicrobiae bacterium]
MDDRLPFVSIIIAVKPEQKEIEAVNSALKLNYPRERFEIIIARGRHPSAQRNAALKEAKGEIIYFLDDDSVPHSDAINNAVKYFSDKSVAIVGGPNLCPPDTPFIEQVFAVILSSFIAFGPSRARYWKVGKPRPTTEKELILCNMFIRKETLVKFGGFDTNLYPNEENALMDALVQNNYKLIYDPEVFVYRRPRRNLRAFTKMLFNYGRGRAEQFRLHPSFGSALNFVPPFFCLYLVLLILSIIAKSSFGLYFAIPLGLYLIAVLAQTKVCIFQHGLVKSLAAMPLQVLTHICYGCGFIRGLFTKPTPPPDVVLLNIKIEKIQVDVSYKTE